MIQWLTIAWLARRTERVDGLPQTVYSRHRHSMRVVTERGIVMDTGVGFERFIGNRWELMMRELDTACWQIELAGNN